MPQVGRPAVLAKVMAHISDNAPVEVKLER
jgi:hypothetical protein